MKKVIIRLMLVLVASMVLASCEDDNDCVRNGEGVCYPSSELIN